MKAKVLIISFIQLLLVIAAAVAFFIYQQGEVEPTKVYVYANTLDVNAEVTETDIKAVSIPAKAVQKGFATSKDEILKKYAGQTLKAGEYVYTADLIAKGQRDVFKDMDLSKYRKISLPISYVEGFGGDIKRGDQIDLIFTGEGSKADKENGGESSFLYSKSFLQNLYVYNVTTGDGFPFKDHSQYYFSGDEGEETASLETSANTEELSVVTLAVTLEQAEEILARQSAGTVRMVSRFEENDSYETLGFILGDYDKVNSSPANAETSRGNINEPTFTKNEDKQ